MEKPLWITFAKFGIFILVCLAAIGLIFGGKMILIIMGIWLMINVLTGVVLILLSLVSDEPQARKLA